MKLIRGDELELGCRQSERPPEGAIPHLMSGGKKHSCRLSAEGAAAAFVVCPVNIQAQFFNFPHVGCQRASEPQRFLCD